MTETRYEVISLMRKAIRQEQSRTSFFRDMKAQKLSYARKSMIADWSSVREYIAKEGKLRFVRKDAYPAKKTIAAMPWVMSTEYMYTVKVKSRLAPDEPITERFVNIVSDAPMTPRMIEQSVIGKWAEWEDYTAEAIEVIEPWTAVRSTI